MSLKKWLSSKKFFIWADNAWIWFLFLGLIGLLSGWLFGLFYAPIDAQQGDAYRIIFVHVPFASGGMVIYFALSLAAIVYWVWRINLADIVIASFAPIGAVLTAVALVTGSIWGKPMWGDWWVWDARLTSCLILFLFYLGVIALRQLMGNNEQAGRACAVLIVVGSVDLPIIHYSVNWWHTLHQPATLLAWKVPSMNFSMLWPLLLSMLGLALFAFALGLLNMKKTILQRYSYKDYLQKWLRDNHVAA